ncbi:MAG: hypothetical protein PHY05_02630 [Methanothrix sp.]|nr:hypothetical protein [Methanothrix sp.]
MCLVQPRLLDLSYQLGPALLYDAAIMLIRSPGPVPYTIPNPWMWLFFLIQLIMGIATLRALLDAPHRFLIRAQLAEHHSPDGFALGIKDGLYYCLYLPILGLASLGNQLLVQFGEDYISCKNAVHRIIPPWI